MLRGVLVSMLSNLTRPRPCRLLRSGNGGSWTEYATGPVLRSCYQAPADWVAVHVLEFLDGFAVVPHVEVILAALPESCISRALEFSRHLLFQNLQGTQGGKATTGWHGWSPTLPKPGRVGHPRLWLGWQEQRQRCATRPPAPDTSVFAQTVASIVSVDLNLNHHRR
jgi:hypothetical protein